MNALRTWLILAAAFTGGAAAVLAADGAVRRFRSRDEAAPQERLRERVRDEIAILVTHPDAITVTIDGGWVRVSGHVLATELDGLLSRLTQVQGVHKVHNALSAVTDPARMDELSQNIVVDGLRAQAYSGA